MPMRSFARTSFSCALVSALAAGQAVPQTETRLASVPATGAEADRDSIFTAVSAEGRFIAFSTSATNVIPGDANGSVADIAVRDLEAGATILVSKSSGGVQGNGASRAPSISADGNRIAFQSEATNFLALDENGGSPDIFLHDRAAGTTILISVSSPGLGGASSQGNGASTTPALSSDGRFVVFLSTATNLVEGAEAPPGTVANVYLRDTLLDSTVLVSGGTAPLSFEATSPIVSGDGRFVAFATRTPLIANDRNDLSDVYLKDVQGGTVTLVSRGRDGRAGAGTSDFPAMDPAATRIAFSSTAGNLIEGVVTSLRRVYAMDVATGTIRLVSRSSGGEPGNQPSTVPSISPDGGFIVFVSEATNLVAGDLNGVSDVFLHEVAAGTTLRVSLGNGPVEADRESDLGFHAVARDGRTVAFRSKATNLVDGGPRSGRANIYARTVRPDTVPPAVACSEEIVRECAGAGGTPVLFESTATDDTDPHPSVTCEPPSGSLFPPGSTTVLCTARDAAGNANTCGFTVRITDGTAPVLTCPGEVLARLPRGQREMQVDFPFPQASEACDDDPGLECTPASGSTFPLGQTAVTCRGTDAAGNADSCQFTVRVIDVTAPDVACPDDIVVDCSGPEGRRVDYESQVSDDIDPSPRLACSPPSGSLFPFGLTLVTCTGEDDAGNEGRCAFTVRVRDTAGPSLSCPGPIRVACASAVGSAVEFSVSAADGCDPDPELVCSHESGATFPIGETAVECAATDAGGNESTCGFTVTIAADEPFFFRGDANRDDTVNISDPIFILVYLFAGRQAPGCLDAADTDDNGALNLSDAVYLLRFLFQGGPSPPPPGADQLGGDASADGIGCDAPVC